LIKRPASFAEPLVNPEIRQPVNYRVADVLVDIGWYTPADDNNTPAAAPGDSRDRG
jgi:hypothetical protein